MTLLYGVSTLPATAIRVPDSVLASDQGDDFVLREQGEARMAETTFYVVRTGLKLNKDKQIVGNKTELKPNLESLYKDNNLFIASYDEWVDKVLNNPDVQNALKIEVRVADDDDLRENGAKLPQYEAREKIRQADVIATATKLEAKTVMVKFFSEAVTTQEEAKDYLADFDVNAFNFTRWIGEVVAAEAEAGKDFAFSRQAAKALSQAWLASLTTEKKKREIKDGQVYKALEKLAN
ncbi:hypothetical protein [Clavibacter michiganensis]|nr:hypothetical protein [Clavibacter michiganensis]